MRCARLLSAVVVLFLMSPLLGFSADQLIALQGKVNYNGAAVNNGNLSVNIWNAASGGTLLYSDSFLYAINNSFFDVMLGAAVPLNLSYGENYWLNISINGQGINWTGGNSRMKFYSSTGNTSSSVKLSSAGDNTLLNATNGTVNAGLYVGTLSGGQAGASIGTNSNHQFRLFTNGTDALTVDTNGNVGIGTTSPGGKLEIFGAGNHIKLSASGLTDKFIGIGSDDTLRLADWATATKGIIINTSTGNVGIGTTTPNALLSLYSTTPVIRLQYAGNTGYGQIESDSNNALIFKTSGANQRMIIDASGNIGINTTSPGTKLDVTGGSGNPLDDPAYAGYLVARFGNTGTNNQAFIQVNASGSDTAGILFKTSSYPGTNGWGVIVAGNMLRIANDTGITNIKVGSPLKGITVMGASGSVGVGRQPSTYKLEVEGDASKTTSGSWQANSDQRIKTDINNISDAVSTLDLVRPVKFKYTDEYKALHPSIQDKYYYNFIAQEFQKVFPSEVTVTNDTLPNGEHILAIDPYVLTPYLVKAVQEQQSQIENLTAQNAEQEREIDALNARVAALGMKQ